MTQVNLLPREVAERQRVRRFTAAVGAGAGVAVILLAFVYTLQVGRLHAAQQALAAQQARNAGLQQQISSLQRFHTLKQEVTDKQALVTGLTQGQIMWSGVMKDVSSVIPTQMWLTQFNGSLTSATTGTPAPGASGTAAPSATTGANLVGTLQFSGYAMAHTDVADWLDRLAQVKGWANPWVSSSQKTTSGNTIVVQWTGTVDLTSAATSEGRQQ